MTNSALVTSAPDDGAFEQIEHCIGSASGFDSVIAMHSTAPGRPWKEFASAPTSQSCCSSGRRKAAGGGRHAVQGGDGGSAAGRSKERHQREFDRLQP